MRKLTALVFAFAMMLSIVFISGAVSSDNSFSAQAQTMTVTRRKKGVVRRGYSGGKYVVKRTYAGGKWVTKKVWKGSKWTARKTAHGTRKVFHKTKKVIY